MHKNTHNISCIAGIVSDLESGVREIPMLQFNLAGSEHEVGTVHRLLMGDQYKFQEIILFAQFPGNIPEGERVFLKDPNNQLSPAPALLQISFVAKGSGSPYLLVDDCNFGWKFITHINDVAKYVVRVAREGFPVLSWLVELVDGHIGESSVNISGSASPLILTNPILEKGGQIKS